MIRRIGLGLLLGILLGTLAGSAFLLGTPAGARVVITWISGAVPNVKLRHESGTLLGPLQLRIVDIKLKKSRIRLDDVVLDWAPSCLLVGEFCIRELRAERFVLTLSPAAPGTAQTPAPTRLPSLRLPMVIDAGHVYVGQFDIVRGEQVTTLLDVDAALRWADGNMDIDHLSVAMPQWSARAGGTLGSTGDWPLAARVQFRTPRTGDPVFALDGDATGSLAELALAARSSGVIQAQLRGTLSMLTPGMPFRLAAEAPGLRLPPSAPDDKATQVRDIHLTANGSLTGRFGITGNLQVETPWTPPLPVTADVIATTRGIQDGTLAIDDPKLRARIETRFNWVGAQTFELDADIRHLDLSLLAPALTSRIAGQTRLAGTLAGDATDVRIDIPALEGLVGARALSARGGLRWHAQQLHFQDLLVQQGRNRARFNGTLADTWALDAALDLDDLRELHATIGGSAQGKARVGGAPTDPSADFDLTVKALTLPEVLLPIAGGRRIQPPAADWVIGGQVGRHGVRIDRAQADGGDFTLGGTGDVRWQDGIDWNIELLLADMPLRRLAPELGGRLSGPLSTHGTWRERLEALAVDTRLAGALDGLPLAVNTRLDYRPGSISVPRTTLRHGENSLEARGHWTADDVDLQLDVEVPQLAMSFRDLEGAITVHGRTFGNADAPDAVLTAEATTLRHGPLQIDNLDAAISLAAGGHGASRASLAISGLKAGDMGKTDVAAIASGTREAHGIDIDMRQGALQLALGTTGSTGSTAQEVSWQGRLSRGQASWHDWHWAAVGNPALSIHAQQLHLDPHCWTDDTARACITAPAVLGSSGELQGEAFHLSPGLFITDFLPLEASVSGQVGATFHARWAPGVPPALDADLRSASPLSFAEQRDDGSLREVARIDQLLALLRAADGGGRADVHLSGDSIGAIDATANVEPATQALSGLIDVKKLNVGIADAFTYLAHDIGGTLDARIDLGGSASAPQLTGQAALHDGRGSLVRAPLSVENVNLDGRFDGRNMVLSGRLRTPRSADDVRIDGAFELRGRSWHGTATAKGNALVVALPPQYQFTTAPDLTLRVDDRALLLGGTVNVPFGRIEIKTLPTQSVDLSRDVVVVREDQSLAANRPLFSSHIDVGLQIGNDVQFKAFGAEGGVNGNLRVRKNPDRPLLVDGELHVLDGKYSAFGQTLQLRQADIIFNGPAEQPLVDAVAVREINDPAMKEVGVQLSGSLRQPETTLWSTPEVPQNEALTWLLTGRAPSTDAINYRGEAASAALSLGIAQGSALLNQAGKQLGLKEFQLSAGGDGEETEVEVGTELNERVYVGYNRRVFSGEDSLMLRLRMTRRLVMEAVSGIESALDVYYTFEF
ncbi:MAG: translocation/assembly module TamB domain-containing protein [Gammaproteobacteria bacterium]